MHTFSLSLFLLLVFLPLSIPKPSLSIPPLLLSFLSLCLSLLRSVPVFLHYTFLLNLLRDWTSPCHRDCLPACLLRVLAGFLISRLPECIPTCITACLLNFSPASVLPSIPACLPQYFSLCCLAGLSVDHPCGLTAYLPTCLLTSPPGFYPTFQSSYVQSL